LKVQQIYIIQKFIDSNFQEWRKEFGNNIVGIHVGYKKKDEEYIKKYSIVFHVSKKLNNPSRPIPKQITIRLESGKEITILTDVVPTGTLKLQSNLGSRIRFWKSHSNSFGSLGFYLVKNKRLYLCSNMHVLGAELLKKKQTYYYRHHSLQKNPDIDVSGYKVSYLEEGYFDYMDVAISRINKSKSNNSIPNYGKPKGFYRISESNKHKFFNQSYLMFGSKSKFQETYLREINIVKVASRYQNKLFASRLLLFTRCSTGGDSGAPIFDPNSLRLLGIVIGNDTDFTYAIPIDIILNRFNANMYKN